MVVSSFPPPAPDALERADDIGSNSDRVGVDYRGEEVVGSMKAASYRRGSASGASV